MSQEEDQRCEYASIYSPLPTSRSIRLIDLNADELNWTLNTFLPPFEDYLIRRGTSTGTNPDFGATEIISNDLPRELELQDDLDCDILAKLMNAALFYYGVRWFSRIWIKQDWLLARKETMFCGTTKINFHSLPKLAYTFYLTQIDNLIAAKLDPYIEQATGLARDLRIFRGAVHRNIFTAFKSRWAERFEGKDTPLARLLHLICMSRTETIHSSALPASTSA